MSADSEYYTDKDPESGASRVIHERCFRHYLRHDGKTDDEVSEILHGIHDAPGQASEDVPRCRICGKPIEDDDEEAVQQSCGGSFFSQDLQEGLPELTECEGEGVYLGWLCGKCHEERHRAMGYYTA